MMLNTLYYYDFREGENKLPAVVSVLMGMVLRSEKLQNRTMSVAHLLILEVSTLKGA